MHEFAQIFHCRHCEDNSPWQSSGKRYCRGKACLAPTEQYGEYSGLLRSARNDAAGGAKCLSELFIRTKIWTRFTRWTGL